MIKGDKVSHFPKSPANPNRKTAAWISRRLCCFAIGKKGDGPIFNRIYPSFQQKRLIWIIHEYELFQLSRNIHKKEAFQFPLYQEALYRLLGMVLLPWRFFTPFLCRPSRRCWTVHDNTNLFSFILCSRACQQLVSLGKVVLNTATPSDCVRFPRRTVVMAKPSMVASTIPKNPFYHGSRDTYPWKLFFEIP